MITVIVQGYGSYQIPVERVGEIMSILGAMSASLSTKVNINPNISEQNGRTDRILLQEYQNTITQ
jgi:hypothetical protein